MEITFWELAGLFILAVINLVLIITTFRALYRLHKEHR